jgi:hypothetical protein
MKRLAVIRKEPSWRRRHKLLENKHPGIGTPLEPFFAECSTALELTKATEGPAVNMAKEMLAAIGLRLAENIQSGKWWHLYTLGNAVRAWSDSRQRPASDRDKIRAALVQLFSMFPKYNTPPPWPKTPEGRRLKAAWHAVNSPIATRHVIENLQPPLKLQGENLNRSIQLVATEMGYTLDASQYTPPTKTRRNPH